MEPKIVHIKETIKSILEDSTIHGIPRILKSKSWISKIAWIIFLCISTSFCLNLIITAVFNYLKFDVVTTIETITKLPADFPVVTICNLHQLQTNYSFQQSKKVRRKADQSTIS